MSAAALVRLARQGELAEGQKIVKVGLVAAPACREGRVARPSSPAEPLCLQLLLGPSLRHCPRAIVGRVRQAASSGG